MIARFDRIRNENTGTTPGSGLGGFPEKISFGEDVLSCGSENPSRRQSPAPQNSSGVRKFIKQLPVTRSR